MILERRIGTTTVRLIAEGGDWWTIEVRPDGARGWVVQTRGKREAEAEYRRRCRAASVAVNAAPSREETR